MGNTSLSSQNTATTLISITIISLVLVSQIHMASTTYENTVSDHFIALSPRSGSRFLAAINGKKGKNCNPSSGGDGDNVCSASPAKKGTQLLFCCKHHCRNVLSDRNNCGDCGVKCRFGTLCCNGNCTAVAYDANNCGECGEVCKPGVRCEYGNCGYA